MPFLAQEGASPPLDLSRLSRFAPDERKKPAALTARATKREGPPRTAFASFFQAEKTLEEKKKEGTKCQKDNMPLGENYYGSKDSFRFGRYGASLSKSIQQLWQNAPRAALSLSPASRVQQIEVTLELAPAARLAALSDKSVPKPLVRFPVPSGFRKVFS